MKLAFIGMGNMAYAILKGGCDRGFFNPAHVSAYDINTVRLAEVAAETGITAAVSTAEAARQADMVLLAVKPNVVESVVAEMGDALCGKAVLSIASGWTTEKLRALLPESTRVMFVIPNTPCMVGEGMDNRSKNGTIGLGVNPDVWRSVIAQWDVEGGQATALRLYPIHLGMELPRYRRGLPAFAEDDALLAHLAELSAPFGTRIDIVDHVGIVRL